MSARLLPACLSALRWAPRMALCFAAAAAGPSWAASPVAAPPALAASLPAPSSLAEAPAPSGTAWPGWQDPVLLDKAWSLPVAATYKPAIEFQRNLSFCGPTSLANVSHSLGLPGDQGDMLDGTGIHTILGLLPGGLTLDELARVARHRFAGQRVTVWRGLDLAAFRQQLRQANEPGRRYIVNFSRAPLFGRGGGHHAPIAGYLAQEDLVLVLDVNAAYGPWLVKPARLLQAMNTLDSSSHQLRGLLLIAR